MAQSQATHGTKNPLWILVVAIAISVLVHTAVLGGKFTIYQIRIISPPGKRHLLVSRLIRELPPEMARISASEPASVPVAQPPDNLPLKESLQVTPLPEKRTDMESKSEGLPTPTPSVLTWDLAAAGPEKKPFTPGLRQTSDSSGRGIPFKRESSLTTRHLIPQPTIVQQRPSVSLPPKKRQTKRWTVDINSFVHDELSQGYLPASLRYIQDIPYPPEAKKQGIEDHILVEVEVSPKGDPVNWRFIRGKPIFKSVIVEALREADFNPAKTRDGSFTTGWVTLDIHFFLQEEK